ncbi:hypothetical protein IEO21_04426 [Rhodonia placenta]|uniref:Yeast cell wall synthesis Kre9/Knh1-like N-terminal domain-containing protein n=1 Tax=Rhodonia placenta TaxID=104341 RepID=A0A8H7P3S2_9APHY|nr:hypothetical protein IEO21_04426 [Postia placenta]
MRFSLAALALALLPAALADITITGPSTSEYWVQDTTNNITWTYTAGSPNPINIIVFNQNNATLNGNFSIASYVNVSQEASCRTNVTLVVGDSYGVRFTSPTNISDIYATSGLFSVRAAGTAPAPTSASSSAASASASASGSASGSAASGTSPSTSGSASTKSSAASPRAFGVQNAQAVFGVIAACGVATLSALLL